MPRRGYQSLTRSFSMYMGNTCIIVTIIEPQLWNIVLGHIKKKKLFFFFLGAGRKSWAPTVANPGYNIWLTLILFTSKWDTFLRNYETYEPYINFWWVKCSGHFQYFLGPKCFFSSTSSSFMSFSQMGHSLCLWALHKLWLHASKHHVMFQLQQLVSIGIEFYFRAKKKKIM